MPSLPGISFIRWRLRRGLNLLPAHQVHGRRSLDWTDGRTRPMRIAYLFTGTYGDFVQCLRPLQILASHYPNSELILFGAEKLAREFASELPPSLRACKQREPWIWLWHPVDMLFTNSVGVFRVRFDFIARFGSKCAYGFRHGHENGRNGFNATRILTTTVQSFAQENLQVLALAGISTSVESPSRPASSVITSTASTWGEGKVLFHIGSAGLKNDFGLPLYSRLIMEILAKRDQASLEIFMGPGDADIVGALKSTLAFEPQLLPIEDLILKMKSFRGRVLCFNSFFAHLCHYLGQRAIVIHREAIPYGYDCAPLHKQVVLKAALAWDLTEVWAALESP